MTVRPSGSVIVVRLVQPLNALSPREVVPIGTVTLFSAMQPENADSPIDVNVDGRVIVCR